MEEIDKKLLIPLTLLFGYVMVIASLIVNRDAIPIAVITTITYIASVLIFISSGVHAFLISYTLVNLALTIAVIMETIYGNKSAEA